MNQSRATHGLDRARAINTKRLAILSGFALVMVLVRVTAYPVPSATFALFAVWIAAAVAYQLTMTKLAAVAEPETAQAMAFALDITLITVLHAIVGGGWWMGATVYLVVSNAAFVSLPKRLGRSVSGYAVLAFVVMIAAHALGIGDYHEFLGIQTLEGHYLFTAVAGLFGMMVMLTAIYLQDSFVRQTRASWEHYRLILANAPDMIVTLDRDGYVVSANDAAYRQGGWTSNQLVGRPFRNLVHIEDAAGVMQHVAATTNGDSRRFEARFQGDSDLQAWHLCTSSPIRDDDVVTGVLLIGRDITERREGEERLRQAQKMEAVGQLAGGIAHDFNNVLTAIRTYANFMLEDLPENHSSRREAVGVSKAVDHAATLTRQLLAFSRRQIMQREILDLNACVRDTEQILRRTLGSSVQLSTSLAADLGMVNADPGQIQQVLINLAVNARDAMPEGGTLRIETSNATLDAAYMQQHAASEPGDYVMIAVRDTGVGMDRDTQARIFEPFFTTKENGKGTGLGLPMVYGIVKQSGGYVWVYSEPGQGTTFKVYLPRVAGAAATGDEPVLITTLTGTETILLVEDEESVREVSSRLLARSGYTVIEAADGREALDIYADRGSDIDVVITDMVMPEIGGRELARRIRNMDPHLPIIFMSGYTDDEELRRSFLDRGSAFLEKPFTPELLLSRIRDVISARPVLSRTA
jgi:PAS domain S-box-containing protein